MFLFYTQSKLPYGLLQFIIKRKKRYGTRTKRALCKIVCADVPFFFVLITSGRRQNLIEKYTLKCIETENREDQYTRKVQALN